MEVLATVVFSGNADSEGEFRPGEESFSVVSKVLCGVFHFTLTAQASGRRHRSSIRISGAGPGIFGSPVILDGTSMGSLGGTFPKFADLTPGLTYGLNVWVRDFDPDEVSR